MAYEILLPAGVAGFGLTSGVTDLFPNALFVFGAHLLVAILLCGVTLAFQGLRPRENWGFTLITATVMILLVCLALFNNMGPLPIKTAGVQQTMTLVKPQLTMTVLTTPTIDVPTAVKLTQAPPKPSPTGPTYTPTNTLIPSATFTITPSPAPTPFYARINAKEDAGALVRKEPDYGAPVVKSLLNGSLVEILPESINKNGITWIKVRLADDSEGWIVRYVLITATPVN
jgi:hypothetical protein